MITFVENQKNGWYTFKAHNRAGEEVRFELTVEDMDVLDRMFKGIRTVEPPVNTNSYILEQARIREIANANPLIKGNGQPHGVGVLIEPRLLQIGGQVFGIDIIRSINVAEALMLRDGRNQHGYVIHLGTKDIHSKSIFANDQTLTRFAGVVDSDGLRIIRAFAKEASIPLFEF